MVSSFSVRPEQVDVLASDIAADAKSIAQELENLNSQVSALIGQWDGSAREAYHQRNAIGWQVAGNESDSWPDFPSHLTDRTAVRGV